MEIRIRAVPPGDRALHELLAAARVEIDARQANDDPATPRRAIADVVRSDLARLVAYVDRKPVGIGTLRELDPDTGEIKRMYVVPAYRGSGVADKLLGELENRARRAGFKAVRLDTHDRLTEANRLYERAGFRRIDDYNSNPRANRWFEKSLA